MRRAAGGAALAAALLLAGCSAGPGARPAEPEDPAPADAAVDTRPPLVFDNGSSASVEGDCDDRAPVWFEVALPMTVRRDVRLGQVTVVGDDIESQVVPGEYESLEQTAVGLRAPITGNLDVLGRWNYSLERSQNVETLAGFEYRPSCCWAGRVAWRRYVADDDGSFDTAIMFQFVLNGLGQFGDTVQSFVDNDVYNEDDRGRSSSSSFDTIRFP